MISIDEMWAVLRSEWKWFLTFIIAFYAACLATYREIQTRKAARPKIVVQLSTSIVVLEGDKAVGQIQAIVENHGTRLCRSVSHAAQSSWMVWRQTGCCGDH